MANRMFQRNIGTLTTNAVIIAGSFAPNGSDPVSAASVEGVGFSVARTSAGLFTVTFQDRYPGLIAAVATLQLATAGDQKVEIGSYSEANKTLQIRVWDIGDAAVADVSADANNRINFICFFRNSGS